MCLNPVSQRKEEGEKFDTDSFGGKKNKGGSHEK
jgi:hypothetical protein